MSSAGSNRITLYVSSVSGNVTVEKNTDRVKFLLDTLKVKYDTIDVSLTENEKQKQFLHANSKGKVKTQLPQVFVDGAWCGGAEELEEANEVGEIKQLLKL